MKAEELIQELKVERGELRRISSRLDELRGRRAEAGLADVGPSQIRGAVASIEKALCSLDVTITSYELELKRWIEVE